MTKLLDVNNNKYVQCDEFGHFRLYDTNIDNTYFNFLRKDDYYNIRVQRNYGDFINTLFYTSICEEKTENQNLYYICAKVSSDLFDLPPDSNFRIIIVDQGNRTINIYEKSNDNYVYYDSNLKTYMVGTSKEPAKFKVEDENQFNSLFKNCEENSIYNKTSGNCEKCGNGQIPNLNKSECITAKYSCDNDCNPSFKGDINTIDECISKCQKANCTGNSIYTRNRTGCVGCDGKIANEDHTECVEPRYNCSNRCNAGLIGEYTDRTTCVQECRICEGNTIKLGNECVDCGKNRYANEDNTSCLDFKYDCNNNCKGSVYGKYNTRDDCVKDCKLNFNISNFLRGECKQTPNGLFPSEHMCETTIKILWVPIGLILVSIVFIILKKIIFK